MSRFDPAKSKKVSVSLPFGIGSAEREAQRPPHLSPKEHEQNWSEEAKLRVPVGSVEKWFRKVC